MTFLCVAQAQDFLKSDSAEEQFADFIVKYGKTYETPEKYHKAFGNFKNTLLKVNDHYGITSFADISEEEFANSYLNNFEPMESPFGANLNLSDESTLLSSHPTLEADVTIDWRSSNVVGPVTD